jgi:hypothetical protein
MKRWKIHIILGAMALLSVMVACGGQQPVTDAGSEQPAAAPAAVESEPEPSGEDSEELPDLVIASGEASMPGDDGSGECVEERIPLVRTVCVQNQGEGDAGAFTVRVRDRQGGGMTDLELEGLGAGEETCLESEGPAPGRATVDVAEQEAESDEMNNNFVIPLYSPPPICSITPTPGPTPTPLPPGEPAPTPYPEGSKVTTEVFQVYNCRYLGGTTYEWYKARVTYVDGVAVEEEILDGPFVDYEWRGGCPSGDT